MTQKQLGLSLMSSLRLLLPSMFLLSNPRISTDLYDLCHYMLLAMDEFGLNRCRYRHTTSFVQTNNKEIFLMLKKLI